MKEIKWKMKEEIYRMRKRICRQKEDRDSMKRSDYNNYKRNYKHY